VPEMFPAILAPTNGTQRRGSAFRAYPPNFLVRLPPPSKAQDFGRMAAPRGPSLKACIQITGFPLPSRADPPRPPETDRGSVSSTSNCQRRAVCRGRASAATGSRAFQALCGLVRPSTSRLMNSIRRRWAIDRQHVIRKSAPDTSLPSASCQRASALTARPFPSMRRPSVLLPSRNPVWLSADDPDPRRFRQLWAKSPRSCGATGNRVWGPKRKWSRSDIEAGHTARK